MTAKQRARLDQTYGALGTFVAEHEIGVSGPIREYYLVSALDIADESQHMTGAGRRQFRAASERQPGCLLGSAAGMVGYRPLTSGDSQQRG